MKTLSAFLIFFIGLNLAATGLATGLCTGESGCLHCAFQPAPQTPDMPMGDMPEGHDCCTTPAATACDFEKNNLTHLSIVYLIPQKATPPVFAGVASSAPDMRLSDIVAKKTPFPPQQKTAYQKTPLFIQHLSLIC